MHSSISLTSTKELVDAFLTDWLRARTQTADDIGKTYQEFWSRIERVALVGGKRIRPYLTIVGNDGIDDHILPVAVAQELVHIAVLIHDDVIDQDDFRHGEKNMNGVYRDVYSPYLDQDRLTHYANSTAILAGDALLSEAYRLIYSSSYPDNTKRLIAEQMATSIYEVIGGELMDVEAAFVDDEVFDPNKIYRYKTAGYSFIGPLLTGAYCQGVSSDICNILEEYATNIGIAFQMQDDLLGVYGDIDQTGKSNNLADIREGKRTALVAFHEQSMNEDQAGRFKHFGRPSATDDIFEHIRSDMKDSGAVQKTIDVVALYVQQANRQLELLEDGPRKKSLIEFTAKIEARKR